MVYFLTAFFLSFLINTLIIRYFRMNVLYDTCKGIQKFHQKPVPRIGGCAIYLASLGAGVLFFLSKKFFTTEFFLVFMCAFPVFFSGLLEDLTKKIAPKWRLLGSFISAILAFFLLSARVSSVDVPIFDRLLKYSLISFLFTTFAVAGVSHAFNIIDGFNGLASGVAMLVFGAYAYVSFILHDQFLFYLSLIMLATTLGFFIWNYPFGYIFLGDCGAYLLGYIAALLGVLITTRHSEVSPWFPLLLVIYPVWETLFSIYRRKFLKGVSPGRPDALHLHTLIYRRLIKLALSDKLDTFKRNIFTSPYLWVIELICVIPAILFWKNTYLLITFTCSFVILYIWLYLRIIKFRTPEFLKLKILELFK